MERNQIANFLNDDVIPEELGEKGIVAEDLSNLSSVGTLVFNSDWKDKYVQSVINKVGRTIMVNRTYEGKFLNLRRDEWTYGSVLEKIRVDIPEVQDNESFMLVDGASYDPNIFYQPKSYAKFFNEAHTYEIDVSRAIVQFEESFRSAEAMNAFFAMLETQIKNGLTINTDAISRRAITGMISETLYGELAGTYTNTGVRAVNLLKMYNTQFPSNPIYDYKEAIVNPDFLRYASYIMGLYQRRLTNASKLFNATGTTKFTPDSLQHIILLDNFVEGADYYLNSSTFHDKFVALPNAETVSYWQGSGTGFDLADTSEINVALPSDPTATVNVEGVLGVMFDRDAIMICNRKNRTYTHFNPKAEFYTNFYKYEGCSYIDLDENFVVFFAQDVEPTP